jgi:hypothetical protein
MFIPQYKYSINKRRQKMYVISKNRIRAITSILIFALLFTAAFWTAGRPQNSAYALGNVSSQSALINLFSATPQVKPGTDTSPTERRLEIDGSFTIKRTVILPNLIDGNPVDVEGTMTVVFKPVHREGAGAMKLETQSSEGLYFWTTNCSSTRVTITFDIPSKDGSATIFPIAIGFGDIDGGQAMWVGDGAMVNKAASKWNNKYWYGSEVRLDIEGGYHKFSGTTTVDGNESWNEGAAYAGVNVNEGEPISLVFTTTSSGRTLFEARFNKPDNPPGPDPDPAELIYVTKDEKGRERFWADGSSANWPETTYRGDTLTAGNWTIKDLYLGSETSSELVDGKVISKTTEKWSKRDGPNNVWYDDLARTKKTFGSDGKLRVYWPDAARGLGKTKYTYAKFTEKPTTVTDETPVPGLSIESAAGDMGMSGGYLYRTDTDVIFSVKLRETGGNDLPLVDDEGPVETTRVTAKFECLGNTYTVSDIVMPKGGEQIVWIKFHTPTYAGDFNINVTASFVMSLYDIKTELDENGEPILDEETGEEIKTRTLKDTQTVSPSKSLPVTIEQPVENTPPDPRAEGSDGKVIQKPSSYSASTTPPSTAASSNKSWSVWKYNESDKTFSKTNYSASLTRAALSIRANDYVKTAENGGLKIKSGYGFDTEIETQIGGSPGGTTNVTPIQSGLFKFPEFNYATYDRLAAYLAKTSLASSTSTKTQHFAVNRYSPHAQEVHYTPLWFPDASIYKVYCYVRDAWTPVGELSANLTAQMSIDGDVFKDWHIAPKE